MASLFLAPQRVSVRRWHSDNRSSRQQRLDLILPGEIAGRVQVQAVERKGWPESSALSEDLIEIQAQNSWRAAQVRDRVVELIDLAVESRPISSRRIKGFLQHDADPVLLQRAADRSDVGAARR